MYSREMGEERMCTFYSRYGDFLFFLFKLVSSTTMCWTNLAIMPVKAIHFLCSVVLLELVLLREITDEQKDVFEQNIQFTQTGPEVNTHL